MIIGIEGVSCVGKTTLATALGERIEGSLVIPCYFHSAADPAALPPPVTANASAQLDSLRAFLDVEALRRERAFAGRADDRTVILDRTVDTLVAHTRAVSVLQGFDIDLAAPQIVRLSPVIVPDITFLLSARFEVLSGRARHRRAMPEILYDPRFTAAFMEHFRNPIADACVRLNGEQPVPFLLESVLQLLSSPPGSPGSTRSRAAPA